MRVNQAKVYCLSCRRVFYGILVNEKYFIVGADGNVINMKDNKNYIILKVLEEEWVDFEDPLANYLDD